MAVFPTRLVSYRRGEYADVRLIDDENETLGTIPEVYMREAIHALVRHQVRLISPGLPLGSKHQHIAELIDALITRVAMETGT